MYSCRKEEARIPFDFVVVKSNILTNINSLSMTLFLPYIYKKVLNLFLSKIVCRMFLQLLKYWFYCLNDEINSQDNSILVFQEDAKCSVIEEIVNAETM